MKADAINLPGDTIKNIDYIVLSQDFIYAAKTGDTTSGYTDLLAQANEDILVNQLDNEDARLAFWLNLYNAYTQVILKQYPEKYTSRSSFFKSKQINIAGHLISLDKIEHGLLRHSKIKWSLGYLNKWFPGSFEKKFRVQHLDYRIHFALNCGAKSCPPIAFYNPDQIDRQLKLATANYLSSEASYDSAKNTLYLPALMNWFRRDFGSKQKMKELAKALALVPTTANPTIKFNTYDWELFLSK
ncbi:MAG: DUF547 domain-containing protein [Ferruginibacter sp.]